MFDVYLVFLIVLKYINIFKKNSITFTKSKLDVFCGNYSIFVGTYKDNENASLIS